MIATPVTRTADTNRRCNLSDTTAATRNAQAKYIGVQTRFEVSVVLKGDKNARDFELDHCREHIREGAVSVNGPMFVSFDPTDVVRQ